MTQQSGSKVINWVPPLTVVFIDSEHRDLNTCPDTLLLLQRQNHYTCSKRHTIYIFYVHGSVHRESTSITVQQDATLYSFIIFSADSSTCFG